MTDYVYMLISYIMPCKSQFSSTDLCCLVHKSTGLSAKYGLNSIIPHNPPTRVSPQCFDLTVSYVSVAGINQLLNCYFCLLRFQLNVKIVLVEDISSLNKINFTTTIKKAFKQRKMLSR